MQAGLIRRVSDNSPTQFPLARARLRGQDMPGECVPANDFTGARLLEPLGRTLMCL
jgi:hypothetical protein